MYQFDIFDVNIPLKQPLPCLHYDFATYCNCLKQIIPAPLPEYLLDLSDVLEDYSKQIKRCRPKSFPKEYIIETLFCFFRSLLPLTAVISIV